MRDNSFLGILLTFGLVVGLIVYATIKAAWSDRWRRPVYPGLQKSLDGSTHIIPGEGHVKAPDCMCRPEVYQEYGCLPIVEHQPLRPVH